MKIKRWSVTSSIIQHYPINTKVFELIINFLNHKAGEDLVETFMPKGSKLRRIFMHILASNLLKVDEEYARIPRKTLRDVLGNGYAKAIQWMEDYELIKTDTHSDDKDTGYCKGYRANKFLLSSIALFDLKNNSKEYINIMTEKKHKPKSKMTDKNGNELPELITTFLKLSHANPFSLEKAIPDYLEYIDKLKEEYKAAEHLMDTNYSMKNERASASAWGKLINAQRMYMQMEEHNPVYTISRTGRPFETTGGLQSCSRELRRLILKHYSFVNYDLKSSQPTILMFSFKEAGIECPWLIDYIENDKKQFYANKLGISVDSWKKIFCAIIFCCYTGRLSLGAIVEALQKEFKDRDYKTELAIRIKYDRIIEETKELVTALKQFDKYLLDNWLEKTKINSPTGIVYRNFCGLPFSEKDSKNKAEFKRFVRANYLQSLEALFIYSLIKACFDANFGVKSHQHDGILIDTIIPQFILDEVQDDIGFDYFNLVEKPI